METIDTHNKRKAAFACVDSGSNYLQSGINKFEYFMAAALTGLCASGRYAESDSDRTSIVAKARLLANESLKQIGE